MKSSGEIVQRLNVFSFSTLVSDLRTAFDLLDRNQDGRVEANELQFMLKNLGIFVRDELIDDLIKEASHGGIDTLIIIFYSYKLLNYYL